MKIPPSTSSHMSSNDPLETLIKTEAYEVNSVIHFEDALDDDLDLLQPAKPIVFRRKKSYSLEQKLEMLERLNAGDSRKEVMRKFDISKSTLYDLVHRAGDIQGMTANNPLLLKFKSLKLAKNPP